MAKCPLGNHGPCAACGQYSDPTGPHAHNYHPSKRGVETKDEILCADCHYMTIHAANLVLRALEDYRKAGGQEDFEDLIARRRILVGFQADFGEWARHQRN